MKRSPKINNSMKHSPRVIMKKKGMQLSHLPKLFSLGTTDLLTRTSILQIYLHIMTMLIAQPQTTSNITSKRTTAETTIAGSNTPNTLLVS